jgi:hypothetical protein
MVQKKKMKIKNNHIIFSILVIFLLSNATASLYYEINLDYNNGSIKINNINVIHSYEELTNTYTENDELFLNHFNISTQDKTKKEITREQLTVPDAIKETILNQEGLIENETYIQLEKLNFSIYLLYNQEITNIQILYLNDSTESEYDTSRFSNQETYEEIQKTQGKNKTISENEKEEESTSQQTRKKIPISNIIIGIILLLLLLTLIIILFRKIHSTKK